MAHALLNPEQHWVCPNCDLQEITHEPKPHSRMHNCGGLMGLTTPMVPDGTVCKTELVDREDYTNGDRVQIAPDGNVYMAAKVTRDDGEDVAVYAPSATMENFG